MGNSTSTTTNPDAPANPDTGTSPSNEFAAFLEGVEEHLIALQTDFLAEGTRKDQRVLLAIATLLLLLTAGVVSVPQGAVSIETPVAKFTADFGGRLILVGVAVCSFFELTFLVRVYSDLTAFGIGRALADAKLKVASDRILKDLGTTKLKRFEETREALSLKLRARYYEQPDSEQLYDEAEAAHNAQILRFLERSNWLKTKLSQVGASRRLRMWMEVLFPLLFGAAAIIFASAARH
ncbi:hypothetical protein LJR290_007972 [Variovorax sp. LjRoot290]|uniref:hypothetical protein n=1 Tax=Variovorax sp. LjRoot290 TaxID=3342316 RepID=UPI003ECEAFD1